VVEFGQGAVDQQYRLVSANFAVCGQSIQPTVSRGGLAEIGVAVEKFPKRLRGVLVTTNGRQGLRYEQLDLWCLPVRASQDSAGFSCRAFSRGVIAASYFP
jgi:hypothetical protein